MSALAPKWMVQRFEPPYSDGYTERGNMRPIGDPKVCEDWKEACEIVELAIGPTCLKVGVEADYPVVVFERDYVVIVMYLELRID